MTCHAFRFGQKNRGMLVELGVRQLVKLTVRKDWPRSVFSSVSMGYTPAILIARDNSVGVTDVSEVESLFCVSFSFGEKHFFIANCNCFARTEFFNWLVYLQKATVGSFEVPTWQDLACTGRSFAHRDIHVYI